MSASLRGKQIAFTGTFEGMNRAAVVKQARAAGAKVLNRGASLSKSVDFLVTGESNVGVKKVQAKQMGITVLPPQSFLKFVKAGGASSVAAARKPQMNSRAMAKSRIVDDFEEDFEEEEAGAMPWETEAKAAPARRTTAPARRMAPKARRQQMMEDFEEEADTFEAEEQDEVDEPMPWETEAPVSRGRTRMAAAPKARRMAAIERPVRKTRTTMAARPAQRRLRAPAADRTPYWSLRGLNVAFTGSFDQLKKSQAIVMAERNGASVLDGRAGHADILVCGKNAEAKKMLAKKRGIKVVGEGAFIAACRK